MSQKSTSCSPPQWGRKGPVSSEGCTVRSHFSTPCGQHVLLRPAEGGRIVDRMRIWLEARGSVLCDIRREIRPRGGLVEHWSI